MSDSPSHVDPDGFKASEITNSGGASPTDADGAKLAKENIPPNALQEAQMTPPTPESASNSRSAEESNAGAQISQLLASQTNLEQQLQKCKRDLESMVLKYAKSERENLQNKNRVDELDKKLKRAIKDNDQLANRIKLLTNDKNQLTDTLNAKVAQLTVLEQKNCQLGNFQSVKLKESKEQIKRLESQNEELRKQIESYKSKEGELLDFSELLSMKHMMLQTELEEAMKKVPNYKDEYELAIKERNDLAEQNADLSRRLDVVCKSLEEERECTRKLREEHAANEAKHRSSMDELQNEIKVMRRKHQIATKELMKEIRQSQVQSMGH